MNFEIENQPVFTTLKIQLADGETVRAEPGAMVSMSGNVEIKAKTTAKGIGGLFKASLGGEGGFTSEYTASMGSGELVLAPPTPGDVLHFNLQGQTVFAQSGAYMAGSSGLDLSSQGSLKGYISGEGLFLQKVSGTGDVFFSAYGSIFERTLGPGEEYVVDSGHMVAFEEGVTYSLQKAAKGFMSTILSGEGIVCRFSGPGRIWIQSRNLSGFAKLIARFLPDKKQ